MPKPIHTIEQSNKLKAVRREKKKRIRMKVSGKSVLKLKKIIENKSGEKRQ